MTKTEATAKENKPTPEVVDKATDHTEERKPQPHDQIVFYNPFGGQACTAFINRVYPVNGLEVTVDLVALIPTEQQVAVPYRSVPYSTFRTPGTWSWN